LRLEQSKSTAASVLRQQVFHFDPVAASAAAGQAAGQGSTPQLLQLGIGGVGQAPGTGSTGPPGGVLAGGGGGGPNGVSSAGTTRFGNNVRLVQEQLQRQNGGPGPGGSTRMGGRITDEHTQEEMLRSYFPGWF
jgi:hypothetical protein